MIDVSILIPAYNVEQYIERCVSSIINQNFTGSYEIIIVDDCSTDNTYSKLLELQSNYSQIIKIVKHNVNKKLSQSRKTAYLHSKGKYLWNVDSDDWIEDNALQQLFDLAVKNDCDVILFNAQYNDGNTNKPMPAANVKEGLYVGSEIEVFQEQFRGAIWKKFFKRSLIDDELKLFDLSINSGEDFLYCFELYVKSNSVYYTEKVLYNYFFNAASITKTVTPLDLFKNYDIRYDAFLLLVRKYKNMKDFSFFSNYIYSDYIKRMLLLKIFPKTIPIELLEKVAVIIQKILITTDCKYNINPKELKFSVFFKKSVDYFGFLNVILIILKEAKNSLFKN